MSDLNRRVAEAVTHFWAVRSQQKKNQGAKTGTRDYGNRTAVTGGKQLDGFALLVTELLEEGGLNGTEIFTRKGQTILPGFFRPTKQWDLVVVSRGQLVAVVEFKSIVGSFGNNMNNRTEEAVGNAADLWSAYREGIFEPSPTPWLGYLMLMQEAPGSTRPVRVDEPHFKTFEEFHGASYSDRCEKLCQRLVRERLYQAASLLLSDEKKGLDGYYREPLEELSFKNFAASIIAHAAAFTRTR